MTTQNWLMVNELTNVLDNIVLWDGNFENWTPPSGYLMLPENTTLIKNWEWDVASETWILAITGSASVGDTWDGTYIITNDPQPTLPPTAQPTVSGAQTL